MAGPAASEGKAERLTPPPGAFSFPVCPWPSSWILQTHAPNSGLDRRLPGCVSLALAPLPLSAPGVMDGDGWWLTCPPLVALDVI